MRVEDVWLKSIDRRLDPFRERRDTDHLADRPRLHDRIRTVKDEPVDRLHRSRRDTVARAGHRGDSPAKRLLRLEDRPRAERVAALQRQAMIEDMKNAHRAIPLPQIA